MSGNVHRETIKKKKITKEGIFIRVIEDDGIKKTEIRKKKYWKMDKYRQFKQYTKNKINMCS